MIKCTIINQWLSIRINLGILVTTLLILLLILHSKISKECVQPLWGIQEHDFIHVIIALITVVMLYLFLVSINLWHEPKILSGILVQNRHKLGHKRATENRIVKDKGNVLLHLKHSHHQKHFTEKYMWKLCQKYFTCEDLTK